MPWKSPTAMQLPGLVHETPSSSSLNDPGLGDGTRLQLEPFHDSARVNPLSPSPLAPPPVAMHAAGPVHETLLSPAKFAPPGLGLDRTCQLLPFHCSVSVALTRVTPLAAC